MILDVRCACHLVSPSLILFLVFTLLSLLTRIVGFVQSSRCLLISVDVAQEIKKAQSTRALQEDLPSREHVVV